MERSPALPVSARAVWPWAGRLASLSLGSSALGCGEKTQSPQACLAWQRLADLRMAVWDGATTACSADCRQPCRRDEKLGSVMAGAGGAAPLPLNNSASLSLQRKRKIPSTGENKLSRP